MAFEKYYFNCSKEYLDSIHNDLFKEIEELIEGLPKRDTQAEVNKDIFWLLSEKNWAYDSRPAGIDKYPTDDLNLKNLCIDDIIAKNKRELCVTTQTIDAKWHSDFAKKFGDNLVQLEVQFGKVETMFKDFCGFRIAYYERRLSLGIEIVMYEPSKFFIKHKPSITGMAYFDIAKKTLPAIGLNCPIFLIGIKE